MASDREPTNTYSAALNVIDSLAGSLALLILVGIAAWIIISSGTGHPTWQ